MFLPVKEFTVDQFSDPDKVVAVPVPRPCQANANRFSHRPRLRKQHHHAIGEKYGFLDASV
jgi:hypothetical protein